MKNTNKIAADFDREINSLKILNTPNARAIRRKYSKKLMQAKSEFVISVARELLKKYKHQTYGGGALH